MMKKSIWLTTWCFIASFFFTSNLQAQTLFTINGKPISVDEFTYVYQKNNINGEADFSEQSLTNYLNLFVNYQLKVQQAHDLGLDTITALMSEYEGYRKQLLDVHIKKLVEDPLVKQEYERSLKDVAFSHIFINKISPQAHVKAKEVIQKLNKGGNFAALAKIYSDDSLSKNNGGKIGYFTALQIGFPQIEDAMYNTPVGNYSDVIETDMGYHILKIDDVRPARGKTKVSMIKVSIPNDEAGKLEAKRKIDSIYLELKGGADFSNLAVKHSDDAMTSIKGGELDWFGINTFVKEFEDVAFSLQNIGDISEPFTTINAWYILKKTNELKTQTFQESEAVIQAKIKRSKFYAYKMDEFYDQIKKGQNFKSIAENEDKFRNDLMTMAESDNGTVAVGETSYELFKIGENAFSNTDVLKFANLNIKNLNTRNAYELADEWILQLQKQKLLEAYEAQLVDSLIEYRSLLNEYKNGVLIFELTKSRVWNKASSDTVGLQTFYATLGDLHKWNERVEIVEFVDLGSYNEKSLNKLIKKYKLNSSKAWNEYLANQPSSSISIKSLVIEDKVTPDANKYERSLGLHQAEDGKLYQVTQIVPPVRKDLSEVKGYVIAAYQEHLEKEWLNELHDSYKVDINKVELQKLIK